MTRDQRPETRDHHSKSLGLSKHSKSNEKVIKSKKQSSSPPSSIIIIIIIVIVIVIVIVIIIPACWLETKISQPVMKCNCTPGCTRRVAKGWPKLFRPEFHNKTELISALKTAMAFSEAVQAMSMKEAPNEMKAKKVKKTAKAKKAMKKENDRTAPKAKKVKIPRYITRMNRWKE